MSHRSLILAALVLASFAGPALAQDGRVYGPTETVDPGDVALWHLQTVHGSGPNRSAGDRRLYINGYVAAENADRGAWTFRNGKPCPLGDPVLIHYEDLHSRPGPHYVDPA